MISVKKNSPSNAGNSLRLQLLDTVAGWVTSEIATIISQKGDGESRTDFEKSILARWRIADSQQHQRFSNSIPSKVNVMEWIPRDEFIDNAVSETIWHIALAATELAIAKKLNGQAITAGLPEEKKKEIYSFALETTIHYIEQTQKQPMTIIGKLKKVLGFNQNIPKLRQPK